MIEIKDLLGGVSDRIFSEQKRREAIVAVFKDIIGLELKPDDIEIKNGILRLNAKPIYKNEILIKKEEIISGLLRYLKVENIF